MKTPLFFTLLLYLGVGSPIAAQSNSCSEDLKQLDAVVRKMPSFRQQMKGNRLDEYEALVARLGAQTQQTASDFACFCQLSQLLVLLKDNHLYFYQWLNDGFNPDKLRDTSYMNQYRSGANFRTFPRASLNLDSLEKALKSRGRDEVEGIYYYERALKVGVYRTATSDSLVGVVLETGLLNWDRGQIAFLLKEYQPNRFRAWHAHIGLKFFRLQKNEKWMHGQLTESNWKKSTGERDYVNIPAEAPLFDLKTLDSQTQYLRLGSFMATNDNMPRAKAFYERIKDSLNAPYLIVDLRNNNGGAFKTSGPFLKLLRQYAKRGNVFALISHRTFSNAEQFVIELKKSNQVRTLGFTTNGTLTYGNNYGTVETLPSGKYKLYITDMKDRGNYLPYEEVGVTPDIFLQADSDWIEQTKQIIKNN